MSKPKILTIAASFRTPSLNKELISIASKELVKGAIVTDLAYAQCDAPTYQRVDDALPKGAKLLADSLLAHDGFVIASPEYNWSIPGGLKNLIDWLSVDPRKPLDGKVALLMCASPSSRGGVIGLNQLRTALQVLGCWVYPHLISIGNAPEQMKNGALAKAKEQKYLSNCVTHFVEATNALTHARD